MDDIEYYKKLDTTLLNKIRLFVGAPLISNARKNEIIEQVYEYSRHQSENLKLFVVYIDKEKTVNLKDCINGTILSGAYAYKEVSGSYDNYGGSVDKEKMGICSIQKNNIDYLFTFYNSLDIWYKNLIKMYYSPDRLYYKFQNYYNSGDIIKYNLPSLIQNIELQKFYNFEEPFNFDEYKFLELDVKQKSIRIDQYYKELVEYNNIQLENRRLQQLQREQRERNIREQQQRDEQIQREYQLRNNSSEENKKLKDEIIELQKVLDLYINDVRKILKDDFNLNKNIIEDNQELLIYFEEIKKNIDENNQRGYLITLIEKYKELKQKIKLMTAEYKILQNSLEKKEKSLDFESTIEDIERNMKKNNVEESKKLIKEIVQVLKKFNLQICGICKLNPVDIFFNCGHCVCNDCYLTIIKDMGKCPYDREIITSINSLFKA